jgi:pteridine reductase
MDETRVVLITGGARRVGRAIAEQFAAEGFSVVFTYNSSRGEAEALAKSIGGLAIKADLTDPHSAVEHIASGFDAAFSRLDVLVNNASLYEPGSLAAVNVEQSRRFMAIHFESPLLLAQHFAVQLRASHGHIINMVDLLAERPTPGYLAYCASKAALVNLTMSLSREMAPEVTVNGVAPGVVEWPENYPEADKGKYLARVPMGRAGTPLEVAHMVHFLATSGSYMTGQIFRLDGGRSVT